MNLTFKFKYTVTLLLIIVSTLFFAVSCSTTKTSDQNSEKDKLEKLRASKLYEEVEVEVGDNYFSPKSLTVKPNTIVIFKNKGISIHDVLSDDHDDSKKSDHSSKDDEENVMSSGNLKSKDIYVVLFTKEGEYGYHCHFHGGPKFGQFGTIIVKAAP